MKLVVFCISTLLLCVHALKRAHPVLFNFGDSQSDTGGHEAGTGILVPWPYGRVFFNKPSGRYCDGRLVLDFLCESLNTTFLRPYLESLGHNDFRNGANFAISGAGTFSRDAPHNLDVQINQFTRFRNRSINLRSKGIEGYPDDEGFKNALYIVDIGGNDLWHAFRRLSYQEALEIVPRIIQEIKNAILILMEEGARNFWMLNSNPLGCLPLALTSSNATDDDIDNIGCLKSLNNITSHFNEELRILCENLQSNFSSSTLFYLDIYTIRYELIANYSAYGFKYATTACCGYGGFPYNVCADSAEFILVGTEGILQRRRMRLRSRQYLLRNI